MGATYTRQSSYTDGDVITAAHTNDEFNQLLAAFAASTGHTHDGTTAEGGPITKLLGNTLTFGAGTAGTDITITFDGESNDGVLKWMEDEDYFEFSDDILVASTEKVQFRDTAIFINSSADGQLDLVADTEIQLAATTIDINGAVDISGNLTVGGSLTLASDSVSIDSINGVTASTAELNILDGVTATTAELNVLDGVTATAAELNILDGVTASASELNIMDGVTATTAELNIMDGVTATTAELNIMDGVTATATELNILDGVTATTAELNILDGVTATASELNLVDGITAGTVSASKAVIADSNKDISGFRNVTITGDLTVSGDDITMGTNTSGHLLIADGTNFNPTAVGDLSEISTIANDDVFLAVDTSGGGLKKVARSTVVSGLAVSGAISNVVEDTTPQLGGDLDVNGNGLVSTSNGNIALTPNGTGVVRIDGNVDIQSGTIDLKNSGSRSKINFYCESGNAHAQALQAAPHSESASNTLTLPSTGGDVDLVSTASTATLTNKTLTSPKINEDVALTATATELNIMDGVTATTAELNIMDGVTSTAAELNILDGATVTATELNIMDGDTSASSTTLVDADRVVTNDNGTMKQVALTDVKTYLSSAGFTTDDPVALAIALG